MTFIIVALVVAIVAIVAVGLVRPRPMRSNTNDIVFRTRMEATGVSIEPGARAIVGALIAAR